MMTPAPISVERFDLYGVSYVRATDHDASITALLHQLAELERDNATMRGADYHQVGVEQEQEIIDLEAKLAEREAEVELLRNGTKIEVLNLLTQLREAERAREESTGLLRDTLRLGVVPTARIAAFLAASGGKAQ